MDSIKLAFYTPKRCTMCYECTMHKTGTLDEESYAKHIKKKNKKQLPKKRPTEAKPLKIVAKSDLIQLTYKLYFWHRD